MTVEESWMTMNEYEKQAWAEVQAWKHPPETWLTRAADKVMKPINKVADAAFETSLGHAATKAMAGVVELLNDAAAWTVQTDKIYEEFHANDHPQVRSSQDIQHLSLEEIERCASGLAAKYRAAGLVEGAATGALGYPGLIADVPALVGLALRAVNEHATYYGFDVSLEAEKWLALQILGAAAAGSAAAKTVAMKQIAKAVKMAGANVAWRELEKEAFVIAMKRFAQDLGIRLTKSKLAQIGHVVGALIGGGFNAWYLSTVCRAATMVYRERYLRAHHDLPLDQ
jgi:hypothetical protein